MCDGCVDQGEAVQAIETIIVRTYGGTYEVTGVPLEGVVFGHDANRVWARGVVPAQTLEVDADGLCPSGAHADPGIWGSWILCRGARAEPCGLRNGAVVVDAGGQGGLRQGFYHAGPQWAVGDAAVGDGTDAAGGGAAGD